MSTVVNGLGVSNQEKRVGIERGKRTGDAEPPASAGVASEVPGVCPPATVVIEQSSDTLELFDLDDCGMGILGTNFSPDDMAEVDVVLQDSANDLFIERLIRWLSAARGLRGSLNGVSDPELMEALNDTTH